MPSETVALVVLRCGEAEIGTWRLTSPADLGVIDALARACLAARRLGCSIDVREASPALRELIELVGLPL